MAGLTGPTGTATGGRSAKGGGKAPGSSTGTSPLGTDASLLASCGAATGGDWQPQAASEAPTIQNLLAAAATSVDDDIPIGGTALGLGAQSEGRLCPEPIHGTFRPADRAALIARSAGYAIRACLTEATDEELLQLRYTPLAQVLEHPPTPRTPPCPPPQTPSTPQAAEPQAYDPWAAYNHHWDTHRSWQSWQSRHTTQYDRWQREEGAWAWEDTASWTGGWQSATGGLGDWGDATGGDRDGGGSEILLPTYIAKAPSPGLPVAPPIKAAPLVAPQVPPKASPFKAAPLAAALWFAAQGPKTKAPPPRLLINALALEMRQQVPPPEPRAFYIGSPPASIAEQPAGQPPATAVQPPATACSSSSGGLQPPATALQPPATAEQPPATAAPTIVAPEASTGQVRLVDGRIAWVDSGGHLINELGVRVDTQGRPTRARGAPGKGFQDRQRWLAAQNAQAAIDAAALSKAPPVKAAAATGGVTIHIYAKPMPPPPPQAVQQPPPQPQPPIKKPPPAVMQPPAKAAPDRQSQTEAHDQFFNR